MDKDFLSQVHEKLIFMIKKTVGATDLFMFLEGIVLITYDYHYSVDAKKQ